VIVVVVVAAPREPLHPYVPNNMLFEACRLRLVESASEPCPEDGRVRSSGGHHAAAKALNRDDRGAWACTHFRLDSLSPCERYAAYDVSLATGRTHQIRVHFAASLFPLANDFYYNESSFFIAEPFRYRAAAAQHPCRWPAGSGLSLPPPPEPWLSIGGEPGRVPWRGRQSSARRASNSVAVHNSRHSQGNVQNPAAESSGAATGPGTGMLRHIAEPLPQATLLGLQASSLHLPVPAPVSSAGVRTQAAERGIHVELPWPAEWTWNACEGSAGSSASERAERVGRIPAMTCSTIDCTDKDCVISAWDIPGAPLPIRPNSRQRRKIQRLQRQLRLQGGKGKRCRGVVVRQLAESEQDPGGLAQQFARWGTVTSVSIRKGKGNGNGKGKDKDKDKDSVGDFLALVEFGGDNSLLLVDKIIAEATAAPDSKWQGRLHRWS
jgi:hypothetical protein